LGWQDNRLFTMSYKHDASRVVSGVLPTQYGVLRNIFGLGCEGADSATRPDVTLEGHRGAASLADMGRSYNVSAATISLLTPSRTVGQVAEYRQLRAEWVPLR
jgi:hypothetical protein